MKIYRNTQGFTEAERKELRRVFDAFDKDRDGEVGTVELGNMLRFIGFSPTFQQCGQVDTDGTGEVSYIEFLKAVRSYEDLELKTFREAFDELDEELLGSLPCADIESLMECVGHPCTI